MNRIVATICAQDLQKWAYIRLKTWPQLLEACEEAKARLEKERGTMIIENRETVIGLLFDAIAAAKGTE